MLVCTIIYMPVHANVCMYSMCGCKVFMLKMHVYGYKWMFMFMYACSSMAICAYVCKLQGCVVCTLVLLDR